MAATLRRISNLVLYGTLAYAIFQSYLRLQEEPTTFEATFLEDAAIFPSLTICPTQRHVDNFTTFEEVVKALEDIKSNVTTFALVKSYGKNAPK